MATPIKVNLESNQWDRMVDALAAKGFTAKTISERSGLTKHQTTYRIRQFGRSLMSYRRGESEEAKEVMAGIANTLRKIAGLRRKIPSKKQ